MKILPILSEELSNLPETSYIFLTNKNNKSGRIVQRSYEYIDFVEFLVKQYKHDNDINPHVSFGYISPQHMRTYFTNVV